MRGKTALEDIQRMLSQNVTWTSFSDEKKLADLEAGDL
jgi:hypothetical protein